MYDRSVPNISLVMRAKDLNDLPVFALPEEYSFRYFQPGDEWKWAEIETSAGEFPNPERGMIGFRRYYPTDEALDKRMIFLTDQGVPFATATAWYGDENPEEGRLHWVSVDNAHQGKGLSKALVSLTMHRMRDLGHVSAYLTTQTASWVAIKVYYKFGFRPVITSLEEVRGWEIVSEKTGFDFMQYIK